MDIQRCKPHVWNRLSFLQDVLLMPLQTNRYPLPSGFISGGLFLFCLFKCVNFFFCVPVPFWLCDIIWGQALWYLSSVFMCRKHCLCVVFVSIWILRWIFLVHWRMSLKIWWGLYWVVDSLGNKIGMYVWVSVCVCKTPNLLCFIPHAGIKCVSYVSYHNLAPVLILLV